jgi:hypothetical protein
VRSLGLASAGQGDERHGELVARDEGQPDRSESSAPATAPLNSTWPVGDISRGRQVRPCTSK